MSHLIGIVAPVCLLLLTYWLGGHYLRSMREWLTPSETRVDTVTGYLAAVVITFALLVYLGCAVAMCFLFL